MTDSPSPVRARSISPEELSEANIRINALTRLLESLKLEASEGLLSGTNEDAYNTLERIERALLPFELPREVTAEDLEHSLRGCDRSRMKRGEFQSGDVDKIRKFLRLSEEEWLEALAIPSMQMGEILILAELAMNPCRNLLLLAIREPGAFRRALVRP